MRKSRFSEEQIIGILKEHQAGISLHGGQRQRNGADIKRHPEMDVFEVAHEFAVIGTQVKICGPGDLIVGTQQLYCRGQAGHGEAWKQQTAYAGIRCEASAAGMDGRCITPAPARLSWTWPRW
ncbi:hypothetical protein [Leisingera aquaemixtae]|uniref:hypothetical protein n=1 Tax=Leisingera aquaemixtae TaxID=1396826 RepID=UPI0011AE5D99|nr:hypothetical protein [Leisingera aquaemixtae]